MGVRALVGNLIREETRSLPTEGPASSENFGPSCLRGISQGGTRSSAIAGGIRRRTSIGLQAAAGDGSLSIPGLLQGKRRLVENRDGAAYVGGGIYAVVSGEYGSIRKRIIGSFRSVSAAAPVALGQGGRSFDVAD